MNFGQALELLKQGKKVAREGWNGKGMYLVLIKHTDYKLFYHTDFQRYDFIAMKTADNKMVPWLASQTDILVEDWEEVK
jgi:hypothetical protein